jgi:hypothetical protein
MRSDHLLNSTPQRLLVAEFLACILLVTFGPLADARRGESPSTWIKRSSSIFGVFFVLGLISTGGKSAAKAAAGFGGIVAVAMLVTNRGEFTAIGKSVGGPDLPDTSGPSEDLPPTTPDGPERGTGDPRPGPDGPFR